MSSMAKVRLRSRRKRASRASRVLSTARATCSSISEVTPPLLAATSTKASLIALKILSLLNGTICPLRLMMRWLRNSFARAGGGAAAGAACCSARLLGTASAPLRGCGAETLVVVATRSGQHHMWCNHQNRCHDPLSLFALLWAAEPGGKAHSSMAWIRRSADPKNTRTSAALGLELEHEIVAAETPGRMIMAPSTGEATTYV